MSKNFLFFLFFCCASMVNAQEKDTLVSKSNDDLKQLIGQSMRSNPKASVAYCEYLLERAKEAKDFENQTLALSLMGSSNRVLGKLDLSLQNQLSAAKLLKNFDNPELKVNVYNALGNIYSDLGKYDKVMPSYFEAIRIAETHNLALNVIAVKQNLAYFKEQIGEYEQALEIVKESRKLIIETDQLDAAGSSALSRNDMFQALIFAKLNQPDSVLFYGEKALKVAKIQKDQFSEQGIYGYLGTAYAQKGQFKKAFENLNRSDSLGVAMGNNITLMETRFALAAVHYQVKNYDEVIRILENSVEITERDDLNYPNNDDNYKLLAEAYKEKGNYEKANYYFEKYIQKHNFKKSLHSIIDKSFDNKRLEEFQGELQQLQSEKKEQQDYLLYLGLGATLVILGLLIVLLRFYRKKNQNEKKFQELHQRLNAFKTKDTSQIVDTKDEVLEEPTSSDVSNEVTEQILEGLQKLEAQEYFLKQECNAYNVSKKIKTNTSYLSKVVNSHYQKNFNTYINDLRINYAIVRLEHDSRFRSFSIQSIAEELGYKSADSFTKYFKQNTGLNPSFYIKQLKNLK